MGNNTKIPKIIHYCWFGDKEIPDELKECMVTWKTLGEYQFVRWDESNCAFDENDFVRQAYAEKRWGFIGGYYRLKALYDYGGNDYRNGVWTPSNEFWTWYLIDRHRDFRLNNAYQKFLDVTTYPKHFFELGGIFRK